MQKEVDQLLDQIDDNALVTFNGKFLVNGQMSGISKMVGAVWYCDGLDNPWSQYGGGLALYHDNLALTDLKDRDGNSLRIEETDVFTVTHVVNGKTYTRTDTVDGYTLCYLLSGTDRNRNGNDYVISASGGFVHETIYEIVGASANDIGSSQYIHVVPNPDGVNGAVADKSGKPLTGSQGSVTMVSWLKDYQLSGFNITIFDGNGIKKDATRALKFKQIQRGEGGATGGATNYNNGGLSSTAATFHVGAGANQSMTVGLSDMRASALGLKSADGTNTISISTRDDALAAMTAFDCAIEGALDQLTSIGALEARLEYTMKNITASTENVQASDSTIRDADMAREFTNYTRDNILTQAAQAMLAQANQDASSILGLLS